MTINQLLSHSEQMEAVRRDFHLFWDQHLVPCLSGMAGNAGHKLSDREAAIAYHSAWTAYVAGAEIRRKGRR
jgi:hypothetical protein